MLGIDFLAQELDFSSQEGLGHLEFVNIQDTPIFATVDESLHGYRRRQLDAHVLCNSNNNKQD